MKCDWVNVSILLFLIFRFDSSIRPPARIRERPLNPPILGDFELRFPQNWGGSVLDMGMGCPEGFARLNPAIQIHMSSALPIGG